MSTSLLVAEDLDAFSVGGFEVHVSVLLGCLALVAGYWLAVGPARRRFGWATEGEGPWRSVSWGAGVAVMFLALNGPVHELADEALFSAHMVQHMLLMLVMPPFLLLGLPPELVHRAIDKRGVFTLGRLMTHPAVAFIAYNAVFLGWHFPAAYDLALTLHGVHIVQHLMFMAVAVMMWWPVVAPVPELERIPDGPAPMLYVFAFGIPTTILSAFLTLSDRLIYPYYALAPRVTWLGPLEDQRLGGLIMWIPGMLIFWAAITAVWFRWTREEYREWRREAREFAAHP